MKPLVDRILAESTRSDRPPRVISCNNPRQRAVLPPRPDRGDDRESRGPSPDPAGRRADPTITTPLIDTPETVAALVPEDGEPIYVVTRRPTYEHLFAGHGWNLLQSAGDFALLRRAPAGRPASPLLE